MLSEQRIRGILFYLSLCIFCAGLPFILSFALGYKFNRRTFHFTKTGLIDLKTQPPGASIYLDGRLLEEKTPTTISELLPGEYNLRLELKMHYPWAGLVKVEEGQVTRLDKIILFLERQDIKQLNKAQFSSLWVDETAGHIYYFSLQDSSVYTSGLEGDNFEKVADFVRIQPPPLKCILSEDRQKLLYFNAHQIAIVGMHPEKYEFLKDTSFILGVPDKIIINVFWYSDNYHIIVVTSKDIEAWEAKPEAQPVQLLRLSKKSTFAHYDPKTDTLYFTDLQKAPDGNFYDNLYKLQLNNKLYPFSEFINLKPAFDFDKVRMRLNGKESDLQ
ncbi:MAG TPA: PEGA domain-containing protein [Candidatus Margulisiibacteriota bacterium]|nr:PEGA domain-containing protein [Candidatus Margulisiibacteriota bacterium]